MNFIKRLAPLLVFFLLGLALWALHHSFLMMPYHELSKSLTQISPARILIALAVVFLNYSVLALNDALALAYNQIKVDKLKIALTSFVGNAVSFNLGMSWITGASVRYRMYSSLGLSTSQIARVVLFCQTSTILGLSTVVGISMLFEPHSVLSRFEWGNFIRLAVGFVALSIPITLFAFACLGRTFHVNGHTLTIPDGRTMARQLLIAVADLSLASLVLYALLPASELSFIAFCGIYVLSITLGAASQVPGGVGVLDASLIWWLATYYPKADIIGAILIYRLLYYILPLVLAMVLLAFFEVSSARKSSVQKIMGGIASGLSALSFLVGTMLLISGVFPIERSRLHVLKDFLSTTILETSHLANNLLGVMLLFLAWGLQRRQRFAWKAGIVVLAFSTFFSLLSGLRYEQAALSLFLLLLLLISRKSFYRLSYFSRRTDGEGSLFSVFRSHTSDSKWILGILGILVLSAWLGFIVYRHVGYSDALWWKIAFSADAPRFLRGLLGSSVFFMACFLTLCLQPYSPQVNLFPDSDEVKKIVGKSTDSEASLALLGDKKFFLTPEGNTGIMYVAVGGFWVSMGDPIGDEEGIPDVIWQFCEEADRCGAKPVFYEASSRFVDIYRDAGLKLSLVGESALVDLASLPDNLEGSQYKSFRSICRHLEQEGAVFRIVDGGERDALLPRLKEISDQWLSSKQGKEKGFSLGFFDEVYLKHFPIAIVESNGSVEAFCNLWQGGTGENLSVDLMRYSADAPRDIMSYLFIKSMQWGKGQGYTSYSLGMAPLSGMDPRKSIWEKAGAMLYRHGESFYNFKGLRAYKEKFHPTWSPCYLVYPRKRDLPLLLPELVYLISHKRVLAPIPFDEERQA